MVAADWAQTLSPALLWKALHWDNIRRTLRDLWWKALHGVLRVGEYWDNIPGYEQCSVCSHCGMSESLEHILMECNTPRQHKIWKAVNDLLEVKGIQMLQLTYGTILAAPVLSNPEESVKVRVGRMRIIHILLTESCHLVWKIRCERVIGCEGDPTQYHSTPEIRN